MAGIAYLREYRPYLDVYLDYEELSPDNNVCERVAKAFATGRKNWLFAKSVDGVDASCFFYSLVETAKAAGINPEKYVEFVLRFGPNTDKQGLRLTSAMERRLLQAGSLQGGA